MLPKQFIVPSPGLPVNARTVGLRLPGNRTVNSPQIFQPPPSLEGDKIRRISPHNRYNQCCKHPIAEPSQRVAADFSGRRLPNTSFSGV